MKNDKEIFKVQQALFSTDENALFLIYNADKSIFFEANEEEPRGCLEKLKDLMKRAEQPKIFVEGAIHLEESGFNFEVFGIVDWQNW